MKNNENDLVDYTIVSKPAFVNFICPHCFNNVDAPFSDVDFKTEYWGDGAYCNCPLCDKEVELDIMIMTDDKCCGTCKYHHHEDIDNGWACVNDRSEE